MNKKTLILGGVLIALIALAYIYQGPLKDWRENLGKPDNFLSKISVDDISKLEVTKDGQTTTLEKQDSTPEGGQARFKIGGTKNFYVNQNISDRITQGLKDAVEAELELVSANVDKKGEFQTDDSGVGVKVYVGEESVADFIIGKPGSDFISTYISKPDSNNTYSVKVSLNNSFNQSEWRDTTIFSGDREGISKVRFQYPTREFTIEKVALEADEIEEDPSASSAPEGGQAVQGEWKGVLPYEFDVDNEKISSALNIMANLTATKIPKQNFKGTGLENHSIIIEATGDGINNTLMVGEQDEDGNYYVKRGDSDNIYLISESQKDELDKEISDLK